MSSLSSFSSCLLWGSHFVEVFVKVWQLMAGRKCILEQGPRLWSLQVSLAPWSLRAFNCNLCIPSVSGWDYEQCLGKENISWMVIPGAIKHKVRDQFGVKEKWFRINGNSHYSFSFPYKEKSYKEKYRTDSRCGVGEISCGFGAGGLEMCSGRLDVFLTGYEAQCEL